MKLVKTNENNEVVQFPYTIGDLKRDNPNVSFPKTLTQEDLEGFQCFIVKESKEPTNHNRITEEVHSDVVFSVEQNKWIEVWFISPSDDEKVAIKTERYLKSIDYKGFWKAFIRSNSYAALKTAATTDLAANVLATELISVFSDAKTGNLDAEAMQIGITEALSALALVDLALVTETEGLLTDYGLDYYITD